METNDFYSKDKISTEEEETLLLKRLITLKKQLEDDEPKLYNNQYNSKENAITNKNISSSKFQYCKVNKHVNKFLSTKIDNRAFRINQNKIKQNDLLFKPVILTSKIYDKSSSLHSTNINDVTSKKKNNEILNNNENTEKHNLEINEIMKNSLVKNWGVLLNDSPETCDISQTLLNIDHYMINVEDYITSSKYIFNKDDGNTLLNNHVNNVHVNRKFQNQLMTTNLLNSNIKNPSTSLETVTRTTNIIKKKQIKKLSEKLIESPNLIKIGNTKLIRRSLFRNKWKINNKSNSIEKNTVERKPLSPLQYATTNTITTSYDKKKWTKISNPTSTIKSKLPNSSNNNKLKWTRPNILSVDNVNNNTKLPLEPKSDKLILFGKNKIIRQSLISSVQSKPKNYLLKHFSHRFALMRKLQQKNIIPKIKNITTINEQVKNTLLKKIENKPVQIKRNGKRSYSMYSYINPTLRSKTENISNFEKNEESNCKSLHTISYNKPQNNMKIINNIQNKTQNLSLINNKILERVRSKKVLIKQLCLVFNRFGKCPKLDQGKCDKRHYKKFITLCIKYLTGECSNENCTLSHNIIEEKIPFCKHYLNSVCVQLNCPYLHEYRDKSSLICKNFLRGYCTLGKKCLNKHLNLCPLFETKNECPHGQKCLYPHIQINDKNTVDVEINEPRYFEMIMPNNEDNENETIHIVPKRHAPIMDLPSYIPLK